MCPPKYPDMDPITAPKSDAEEHSDGCETYGDAGTVNYAAEYVAPLVIRAERGAPSFLRKPIGGYAARPLRSPFTGLVRRNDWCSNRREDQDSKNCMRGCMVNLTKIRI